MRPGRRVPELVRWAAALALLSAVLVVEVSILRDRIAHDLAALAEAGRTAGAAPTVASAPPVHSVLPPAAGDITVVDLRAVGVCAPDTDCQVRMLVRLAPRRDPAAVGWRFQLVDRCSGAVREAIGGTVHVGPSDEGVAVVDSVRVPPGPAQAVIAVSWSHPVADPSATPPAAAPVLSPVTEAALAASSPLLVPARAAC